MQLGFALNSYIPNATYEHLVIKENFEKQGCAPGSCLGIRVRERALLRQKLARVLQLPRSLRSLYDAINRLATTYT